MILFWCGMVSLPHFPSLIPRLYGIIKEWIISYEGDGMQGDGPLLHPIFACAYPLREQWNAQCLLL
ncbi:hypothetical protein [Pasteuria penetrans]|uniref:hypothetical protein n=1 Tax=Pasteuria penetrans TaxID=86005 RepID=UPI000FB6BD84|nr:hypothetical protein [Pasteuria penetrans]